MQDEDVWDEKSGRYGVGFIDPNTINQEIWVIEHWQAAVEESMLEFLKHLNTNEDILLPYNFMWVTLSCNTNSVFAY